MVRRVAIDHVTAVVADADAAADALGRVLGVDPDAAIRVANMDIRTFAIGDAELHLNAPSGPGPVGDHLRDHGPSLHHLALRVEGLDSFLDELASRGVVARGQPIATAPGIREVFLDPETTGGIWIQLVERDPDLAGDLDPAALERLIRSTPEAKPKPKP